MSNYASRSRESSQVNYNLWRHLVLIGATVTLMLFMVVANAQQRDTLLPPGEFVVKGHQALETTEWHDRALAAEKAEKYALALTAWERVIDRCASSEEQTKEARAHIKTLRPKVARNTDPKKARAWTVLAVIFRELQFSWTDNSDKTEGKLVEVHKTISDADETKIRTSLAAFQKHVLLYSSGMLRLDIDIRVIDQPLTKLAGGNDNKPPFTPAPHLVRPFVESIIKESITKDHPYDTVIAYVKFNGDQGPTVPAPFTAATYGSISDFNGAGYTMVPWHTNYPYPGETDGEMELHEWLHQIQSMFVNVLHYPQPITANPDGGRVEGENRPGGDSDFGRKQTETTWIHFYQHIMEDHYTRQMWSEATMRPVTTPQTPPGS